MNPADDAIFSLAMLRIRSGGDVRGVARVLQDEWFPGSAIAKRKKGDGPNAGDHGDPEIARQERAFYDALTAGQKVAYDAIMDLVDAMFDERVGFDDSDPWGIDATMDEWKAKAFAELATHPAKAYMLGQMLASEKLLSPLHRPMLPTDGRAIQHLNNYAFSEIDSSFEELKANLRAALITGITEGKNPKEVARKLANELDDYSTQWDVISITETARAETQGRLHEFEDAGEEYCIGSSAHDSRTCDDCERLINNKVHKVKDLIKATNYGKKRADWVACVPAHPRCRCVLLPHDGP